MPARWSLVSWSTDVGDGGADDDDNAHHQDRQAQGAAPNDNGLLLQSCFPAFQF